MLETPHVIVGAVIASKIGNPWLSVPLAFASHFLLDKVPHWNPYLSTEIKITGKLKTSTVKIIGIDSELALLCGLILALRFLPNLSKVLVIVTACFFAILPDLLEFPYYFLHTKNPLIKKWVVIQKHLQTDTTVFYGLFTQVLIVFAALMWFFN